MQEWIPEDDIVRFVIETAEMVPMDDFQINERGTEKDQFHLRGLEKVNLEWTLLATAYNVRRLAKLMI